MEAEAEARRGAPVFVGAAGNRGAWRATKGGWQPEQEEGQWDREVGSYRLQGTWRGHGEDVACTLGCRRGRGLHAQEGELPEG